MKKLGVIATISAMINGLIGNKKQAKEVVNLHQRKTYLLTNGYNAPIPSKLLNQRQKRKLARQTNRY